MTEFLWGTKDIRGDVKIMKATNDTLTFDVDGSSYTITLEEGVYHTLREKHSSALVEALKEKVMQQTIPIEVMLGGALNDDGKVNYVVFEHKSGGVIDNFGGTMKSLIFN
ncbi:MULTISPECIES: hypothetical protein [Paenibacillus]|uniref:hypothetical protein n=1 Tax=Paenibacillus TaxID=44249 RepID=UPI000386AF6B|nr:MULTISPECIES: hypothetical protein [Paenibacillus]EPY09416.1 hypothetical protein PAAL66ix_28490 [Paenibacillus alvei A6-6i-x]SDE40270.1 hypothetical protein SAMN04488689_101361 [Paenibacillus sp. cl6col]